MRTLLRMPNMRESFIGYSSASAEMGEKNLTDSELVYIFTVAPLCPFPPRYRYLRVMKFGWRCRERGEYTGDRCRQTHLILPSNFLQNKCRYWAARKWATDAAFQMEHSATKETSWYASYRRDIAESQYCTNTHLMPSLIIGDFNRMLYHACYSCMLSSLFPFLSLFEEIMRSYI